MKKQIQIGILAAGCGVLLAGSFFSLNFSGKLQPKPKEQTAAVQSMERTSQEERAPQKENKAESPPENEMETETSEAETREMAGERAEIREEPKEMAPSNKNSPVKGEGAALAAWKTQGEGQKAASPDSPREAVPDPDFQSSSPQNPQSSSQRKLQTGRSSSQKGGSQGPRPKESAGQRGSKETTPQGTPSPRDLPPSQPENQESSRPYTKPENRESSPAPAPPDSRESSPAPTQPENQESSRPSAQPESQSFARPRKEPPAQSVPETKPQPETPPSPSIPQRESFVVLDTHLNAEGILEYASGHSVTLPDQILVGLMQTGENPGKELPVRWAGKDLQRVLQGEKGSYVLQVQLLENLVIHDVDHGKAEFSVKIRLY